MTPNSTSYEALFIEQLPVIDRLAASIARRHGLQADDASDLASWIKLKIVEDEYEVFRRFRGESAIGTYLAVVVAMLARDYRAQRWGRWRPSAAARRHGPLAVRLERMVRHHGTALHQAGEALRTAGETTFSDRQLAALLDQLPERGPLRPINVGPDAIQEAEASEGADVLVSRQDAAVERARADTVLLDALAQLPIEDRVLLTMRFWEGLSVADIARGLALEQKPLYRRIERLLRSLRETLRAAGLEGAQLRELLGEAEV